MAGTFSTTFSLSRTTNLEINHSPLRLTITHLTRPPTHPHNLPSQILPSHPSRTRRLQVGFLSPTLTALRLARRMSSVDIIPHLFDPTIHPPLDFRSRGPILRARSTLQTQTSVATRRRTTRSSSDQSRAAVSGLDQTRSRRCEQGPRIEVSSTSALQGKSQGRFRPAPRAQLTQFMIHTLSTSAWASHFRTRATRQEVSQI